jgi:hypothetical protein
MTDDAHTLDRWRFPPGEADWDDVLRRAGVGGRRARGRLIRRLALAIAAAMLLAVPAFALVGVLGGEPLPPGPRLSARLSADARVEMSAPNTVLVRRARGDVVPITLGRLRRDARGGRRMRPGSGTTLAWRLEADGPARALELRGPRGRLLARLCAPCAADASGQFRLLRPAAVTAFNDRATVALVLDARTLHARLRAVRPR